MFIKVNLGIFLIGLTYLTAALNSGQLIVALRNMYIENMDPTLCNLTTEVRFYNRTTKISRLTAIFRRDMSQSRVHLVVYQWRDNQFKKFTPIEVEGNLYTLLKTKLFDIENVCRTIWKPPLVPPIKPNVTYIQRDYAIGGWPVYLPEGQWKVKIHMFLRNNEDLMATLVVEVNTMKPIARG